MAKKNPHAVSMGKRGGRAGRGKPKSPEHAAKLAIALAKARQSKALRHNAAGPAQPGKDPQP